MVKRTFQRQIDIKRLIKLLFNFFLFQSQNIQEIADKLED